MVTVTQHQPRDTGGVVRPAGLRADPRSPKTALGELVPVPVLQVGLRIGLAALCPRRRTTSKFWSGRILMDQLEMLAVELVTIPMR